MWNDPNAFIFHSCDEKREIVNNARNQRLCAAFFPLTSIIDNDNAVSLISSRLVAAFRIRIHPDPLHLAGSGPGSGSTSIPAPDPDPDPLRFLSSDPDPDPLKKALIWIRVAPKI